MFKPGESGNPAGRTKGSKNKANEKLRDAVSLFLDESFEQVKKDFQSLRPHQRLRYFTELLQYAIPKLKDVSISEFERLSDEDLDRIIKDLTSKADEKS